MKLEVDTNEVVLSNVGATGEFRIRNSAKAFKILSDGLYKNKIRAIVRELSCNAVDSHVAAGTPDLPFEVHLPTMFEPYFAVKDFGVGLDHDQVVNIYTTYFESTKTDSNAFIGALGLGSKSPFSYTENFTVTAIKGGYKRIYSAFINESGVPSIAQMSEELTDEHNGVEVKFSVADRYDYNSFKNECNQVFRWFKLKPKFTGDGNFSVSDPTYKELDIAPGVHTMDFHGSIAVMGNIAYSISEISESGKHFGSLAGLLSCGLVMEFDIGELDFAASREELSIVPLTIRSIKKKLEQVNSNLMGHIAKKADAITCEWERAAYLCEREHEPLFKAAVLEYVKVTKFALFDTNSYHGRKEFFYSLEDLKTKGITIQAFRMNYNGTSKVGASSHYINNKYTTGFSIPVDMKTVIVLNDLKTGCLARARFHYNEQNDKNLMVFCITADTVELDARQPVYDAFMKELHNPPKIAKASDLNKPPKRERSPNKGGICKLGVKSERRSGYEDSYGWYIHGEELDEDVTYYYVRLSNHTPIRANGAFDDFYKIKAWVDNSKLPASQTEVFGVRQFRIAEIEEMDNWVDYEEYLKQEIAKVDDKVIANLVQGEILDSYYSKAYISKTVAKLVGPNSDYAKFVQEHGNYKKVDGNVTELVQLCSKYGRSVQVDTVKEKIKKAKDELYAKYPLLEHIGRAQEKLIADYIKLVDKEKVNE